MSDATTPAVVQDAQRVIKQVTEVVRAADRAFESSGGSSRHWVREQFIPRLEDAGLRIVPAVHMECLEDEVKRSHDAILALTGTVERLEAERDALLAEHEAVGEATRNGVLAIEVEAAHDNAERVIHGE